MTSYIYHILAAVLSSPPAAPTAQHSNLTPCTYHSDLKPIPLHALSILLHHPLTVFLGILGAAEEHTFVAGGFFGFAYAAGLDTSVLMHLRLGRVAVGRGCGGLGNQE
jgi:hypothetical protein